MKQWKNDVAVLLIFFTRDNVFAKTFAAVKEARPRYLLLWQDGPRENHPNDINGIERCRQIAENIDWECEVYKNYQDKNWGCDPSTFYAHKWAFSIVDKCIILEDDCVPSQSFFPFCKELLDKYENDLRINRICGFNHEGITQDYPYDYFFSSTGSVWGWATWKRVAETWDETYSFANDEFIMNAFSELRHDKSYKVVYNKMKRHQALGVPFWESINTYARLLNNQLNIVATKNLISNIGVGTDSTHSPENINLLSENAKQNFFGKTYSYDFPLKHPKYVFDFVRYRKVAIKQRSIWSKFISGTKRLLAGDKTLWDSILTNLRIKKLTK